MSKSVALLKQDDSYPVSLIVNGKYRIQCLERKDDTYHRFLDRIITSIDYALQDEPFNPFDSQ